MTNENGTVRAFSARDPEIARAGQAITEAANPIPEDLGKGHEQVKADDGVSGHGPFAKWFYAFSAMLFLGLASMATNNFQLVACIAAFVFLFALLTRYAKP